MAEKNKKSKRRNIIEWALWLGIPTILYFTGLHTEVIGKIQQIALSTGIVKPDLKTSSSETTKGSEILYDFLLEGVDGKELNLEAYKGKVIFMNFWATWCPPCIAEMPGINNLYKAVASEDIVFVMISLDEDFSKAEKFIEKKGYSFPIYQVRSNIPEPFRSQSIPTTFMIAPNGTIAASHKGMADYDNEKVRGFLKGLWEDGL